MVDFHQPAPAIFFILGDEPGLNPEINPMFPEIIIRSKFMTEILSALSPLLS